MKLENSVKTDVGEVILRERITAYLTKSGYRLSASQPSLIFQRGSMFGSLMSFSPKGWESNVTIDLSMLSEKTSQAAIVFDINTNGQWVTDKERVFWQMELNNLVDAISTGNVNISANTENASSAFSQNLMAFGLIIGLGIIMAIGGLVIWGTRNASLFSGLLGSVLGVLIAQRWLNFKIGD